MLTPAVFKHKREKGNTGEDIACLFLQRRGFAIVARNYLKKWGELDVIAEKDNQLHFFEVKSVTAPYADDGRDAHRPEDNVHSLKLRRIRRMISTYMAENARAGEPEAEFLFHVLCVYMDLQTRRARVKWIENVIL